MTVLWCDRMLMFVVSLPYYRKKWKAKEKFVCSGTRLPVALKLREAWPCINESSLLRTLVQLTVCLLSEVLDHFPPEVQFFFLGFSLSIVLSLFLYWVFHTLSLFSLLLSLFKNPMPLLFVHLRPVFKKERGKRKPARRRNKHMTEAGKK